MDDTWEQFKEGPPRLGPEERAAFWAGSRETLPDADLLKMITSFRWAYTRVWRELNYRLRPALEAGYVDNVADMKRNEALLEEWQEFTLAMLDMAVAEALDRGLRVPKWKGPGTPPA
jgi:hypothetical protein